MTVLKVRTWGRFVNVKSELQHVPWAFEKLQLATLAVCYHAVNFICPFPSHFHFIMYASAFMLSHQSLPFNNLFYSVCLQHEASYDSWFCLLFISHCCHDANAASHPMYKIKSTACKLIPLHPAIQHRLDGYDLPISTRPSNPSLATRRS
jgi:hypothetical protein